MSGWSDGQVRVFAKRIADSKEGRAWWAFPYEIREAIISEVVLSIVFGQDKGSIQIEDVRALRIAICKRLAEHHKMPTERYTQSTPAEISS